MTKRSLGWLGATALALLITSTALVPGYRLNKEIDAARREGLWVTFDEMRRSLRGLGRNAAPLVERENFRVSASPTATSSPAAWREVSNCGYCEAETIPSLDDPFLTSDTFHLTAGVEVLCAKARTGASPRENLLAAARIVRLIGREPSIGGLQWWATYGRRTLEAAKRLNLAPEVAREMGPAPDWRRALFAVLPAHLQAIERQHEVNRASFPRRFALSGPLGAYARLDVIHAYRESLRRLSADAAAVDDATLTDVKHTILAKVAAYAPSYAPNAPFQALTAASLGEIGRFEGERRAALKGR